MTEKNRRLTYRCCIVLICVVSASCLTAATLAQDPPADSVLFQDVVYVSMDKLAECFGGKSSLTNQGRGVLFSAAGQDWEFANGGDRLKQPGGDEQLLKRPLLVLAGRHFLPLDECSAAFGYTVQRQPRLELLASGKQVALEPRSIDSIYHGHRVENLKPAHEFVVVKQPLRGKQTLHREEDWRELPAGAVLLIRRTVKVDGVMQAVATDCGEGLASYLVDEQELRQRSAPRQGEGLAWHQHRDWLAMQALQTPPAALRHADRQQVDQSVAVTVDLCWSLRQYERGLFRSFSKIAASAEQPIHPTVFVSGRWLDQHPGEMHDLIQWSHEPRIALTWGLHSWDHPKSGGFMNDYGPDQLRADTMRLERAMLEWGIAPSAYYRFPGLIHDTVRLKAILDLDLLPVDCDSWLALVKPKDADPFYNHPRAGSIILVHGNGNEPAGIPLFERWRDDHRGWKFAPLNEFWPKERP